MHHVALFANAPAIEQRLGDLDHGVAVGAYALGVKSGHHQSAMLSVFLEIDAEEPHTEVLERRRALRLILQSIARAREREFEIDLMLGAGRARGFRPVSENRARAVCKGGVEIGLGALCEHDYLTVAFEQPSGMPEGIAAELQHVTPATDEAGRRWAWYI